MKLFKWHLPGTRDKGAEISDLEAQGVDLQRALAETREELRQETLRLTEQIDDLGSDLNEAEGDQELQAVRGPIGLPENFERNPAMLYTGPVSNQQEQQDPVEAWKARWPNYCRACGGWGVFQQVDPALGETTLTLCLALPEGTCHRCGALDPENAVLSRGCQECGWDHDDGIPEAE
jgi:hypothetical protein